MTSELTRCLYEDCINSRRLEDARALLAENYAIDGKSVGFQGWLDNVNKVLNAFPAARFVLDQVISDGDHTVIRWYFDATHDGPIAGIAATGRKVTQKGIAIYRQCNGRLAECWQQVDRLGVLEQIGAMTAAKSKQRDDIGARDRYR